MSTPLRVIVGGLLLLIITATLHVITGSTLCLVLAWIGTDIAVFGVGLWAGRYLSDIP